MRHLLFGCAVAGMLSQSASAAMPVIDAAQLFRWVQQAQQMQQSITYLEGQLHALTNVPQNLLQQVEGLLQGGLRNPLGDLQGSLQAMLTGRGVGTCTGSEDSLTRNLYASPGGNDFTGAMLGASAQRNAGIQACMQQMLGSVQRRLELMPQLLNELAGSHDLTQIAAVSGRIQQEDATANAEHMQIQALYQASEIQRNIQMDQVAQKQRMDSLERMRQTAPGQGGGGVRQVQGPQPFIAQ